MPYNQIPKPKMHR